jgi:heme-degrading monooxygenase HmoA
MIAVIFEVWPADGKADEYFGWASSLRANLERIDGFISIERFESLVTKGKYLSLSFWHDEESVRKWCSLEGHRSAQVKGRTGVFSNIVCVSRRSCETTE